MSEVYLRHAECSDMELLLEWANDQGVRANSFCSAPITFEEHKRWFNCSLADKDTVIYIFCGAEGPIGQIRLNRENSEAEISYSISSAFRGMGYGEKLVYLAEKKIGGEWPDIKRITARVKSDNIASRKVFERCGYVCAVDGPDFRYHKELNEKDCIK